MKLYPELFLTPWHAGVLLVTVLALLALIIGKYDSKTIVKHTLVSSLIAYAFLTFVLMLVMQEPMYKKKRWSLHLTMNMQNKRPSGIRIRAIKSRFT